MLSSFGNLLLFPLERMQHVLNPSHHCDKHRNLNGRKATVWYGYHTRGGPQNQHRQSASAMMSILRSLLHDV